VALGVVTRDTTVYAILPGRGIAQAASVIGLDDPGVVQRDGWHSYRYFRTAAHQTCLAHLLRRCRTLLLDGPGRPRRRQRRMRLFHQHLITEFEAIFSFLSDPTLDATNWRAEHALRPAVITRKTCGGGNRTARGAASQHVLTSVLRTADRRGLDATAVLVTLLTAPTPAVPPSLQAIPALH
jgi:transposase